MPGQRREVRWHGRDYRGNERCTTAERWVRPEDVPSRIGWGWQCTGQPLRMQCLDPRATGHPGQESAKGPEGVCRPRSGSVPQFGIRGLSPPEPKGLPKWPVPSGCGDWGHVPSPGWRSVSSVIRARVLEKDRAEPAARCVLVFALRGKGEGRRISPTRGCAASGQHTGAPVKEGAGGAADGDDEEGSKARARTPAMPTRRVTQGR